MSANCEQAFRLVADHPATEPFPWVRLADYADQLAELVPKALPPGTPVLLSGEWGTGKTTLLRALQRRLRIQDDPCETLWFEAWRYEAEGNLLAALVRRVWLATPVKFQTKEDCKVLFDTAWRCALALGVRSFPLMGGIPGMGILGTILKGVTTDGLGKEVEATASRRGLEVLSDATERLWDTFHRLVKEAWEGRRLVIFIDDLDRCTPEAAMILLDAIRMLLDGNEADACQFVVALDRKVLSDAVSRKFTGISSFDGNRYLEKLFPVSFAVPTPTISDVEFLVSSLLGADGDASRGDHEALQNALRMPQFANPRLIKRCVNRFRLVVHFEEGEIPGSWNPGIDTLKFLARWLAAVERWPALRRLLALYDEQIWSETLDVPRGGIDLPSEIQTLTAQDGFTAWLKAQVVEDFTEYRQAESILQRWGL